MLLRFQFEGRLAKAGGKPNISARQAGAACDAKTGRCCWGAALRETGKRFRQAFPIRRRAL